MRVIRLGVFETNSSSTHSMTILSPEEYKKWREGEIFKKRWEDEFFSKEETNKIIEKYTQEYAKEHRMKVEEVDKWDVLEYYSDDIPLNFDDYDDAINLERDIERYTTKNGEELVILCWYGYEG